MTVWVNVYDVAQAYGGPEEGGWWFDTGTPVASIPVELTEEEWDKARRVFAERMGLPKGDDLGWDEQNAWVLEVAFSKHIESTLREKAWKVREEWEERYPWESQRYSSVLPSTTYNVVIEDRFARAYPDERPHYE